MYDLNGKVAIITGGASGMGRAASLLFAQAGANVVVADLNDSDGEDVVQLASGSGNEAVFQHTDVSAEPDIKALIECAMDTFGRLDIMFNNAGIGGAIGPLEDVSVQEWDRTQAVCLRGVFLGMKHAAAPMRAAAVVTLNRPTKGNAISIRLGVELKHALERAENDKAIVGVVITGAGSVFCSGADVEELQKIGESGNLSGSGASNEGAIEDLSADPGRLEVPEGFRKGAYSYFAAVSKPIIAAVNGAVAGAGMSMILSCDMRFFAQSGFVVSSFSKRGLTAELGIAWMLQRMVGIDTALDILWSSRKIRADEAKELKLATRVYPDEDLLSEAVAYIDSLADGCSPASIASMKGQIYRDIFRDPTESFKEAHRMQKEALTTQDFVEGINAFIEKRKPDFQRIGD